MRNFDVLIDKFNGFTSFVEVHIYSQEDKIAIMKVIRRIILRCIFRKWDIRVWTGWIWLGIGTGGEHL
jgi:hypothetical protein